MLDLSRAVVVVPQSLREPERNAVGLLVDDVARKPGIRWKVLEQCPGDGCPVLAVGPVASAPAFAGPFARTMAEERGPEPAEGYRIRTAAAGPEVLVAGNDTRGVLFGVGRLLRDLWTAHDHVLLPWGFQVETSPSYPLRGHQLGYRPKTNSYDGWVLPQW